MELPAPNARKCCLDSIPRDTLIPLPGEHVLFAIEDIDFSFDDEMRFIAGHFLPRLDSGVQLVVTAIGLRRPQINASRRRIVRVNVVSVVGLIAGSPAMAIVLNRSRISAVSK